MDVRVEPWRRLTIKYNWCFQIVALQKTLENPLYCKQIKSVNPKGNQLWIFIERLMLKLKLFYFGHLMQRTDSFEKTLMPERLRAGGEGDDRGWDGCMASPTQRTRVWASSRSWWWTRKPGVLQSIGSQTVRHNWATELSWTELMLGGLGEEAQFWTFRS